MNENYKELLRLLTALAQSVDSETVALHENNTDYLNQVLDQKDSIIESLQSGDWAHLLPQEKEFAHSLLTQILTGQKGNSLLINEISQEVKSELQELRKAQIKLKEFSRAYGGQYAQSNLNLKA